MIYKIHNTSFIGLPWGYIEDKVENVMNLFVAKKTKSANNDT